MLRRPPAADSLRLGALPIGLAHGARLIRGVGRGELVHLGDVELAADATLLALRESLVPA